MPRSNYNDKDIKDKVWNKAKKINGKNPNLYRLDPYNTEVFFHSHGKNSLKGWNIDHIKPISKNGSNDIINLQVLNSKINLKKSNSLVKKSRHYQ